MIALDIVSPCPELRGAAPEKMVFDAGGDLGRRRHRFSSSCSVLLVGYVLVMFSVSIPVAPPPEIPRSASSSWLKLTISSIVGSSSHHRCFHCVNQGRAFVVASSAQPASPHPVFVTTSRRRHRPDPSPAPLTAVAPPPRVYISPHLGRFFISRVLAPPLFCIIALPNRKEAPRILLVWRHDCSNGMGGTKDQYSSNL
ncbi:Uncharacterized protein Rs2_33208 [Raphanus sativus]|nr:Uncharacterized protein Rs2_33208 [Raphanus sativus]